MAKIETVCSDQLKEKVEKTAKSFEMSVASFVRWVLKEVTKKG